MSRGASPGYTPPAIPERFNVAAALLERRQAAGDGDRPAVIDPERTWTYGEMARLSAQTANALAALGVRREDRVLVALPDSAQFVAAYLGTMLLGAVAVPCNTFLSAADYRYFLAESGAALIVTTAELLGRIAPAVADAPHLGAALVVDALEDTGLVRAWRHWVDEAPAVATAADTHKDAAAFWLWTSGSTGAPKAAVHLHQDWPWCCEGFATAVLGVNRDDRLYSAAKLFHAYGLGNGLVFPFWIGAPAILRPERSQPATVFATIAQHRPTVFFGVPTLYAGLLQHAALAPVEASSLRVAVSAGEPLPAEIYRRWQAQFGIDILDAIGSTEVLHCYLSARAGRVVAGSVGEPVPGYAVRIVDERDRDVAQGEVGELLVHGPSSAPFYWQRRDQTTDKMRGRWFASGDRYRVDADGHYWHIGRSDDMFKVAGEWCSATEVEAALAAHPAVVECAVVPQADASGVLKPRAVVVAAASAGPGEALAEELRAFVRERLAHYKCPRTIDFATELPKTATGKIQRFRLRQ